LNARRVWRFLFEYSEQAKNVWFMAASSPAPVLPAIVNCQD